ncbi:MAG: RNA polymerase sigma factor [Candidatus Marinimicrobia bacterium]|jgi:RNA polymerase sigma-70 factor (ECF subfamily)|nr:RNA polymerase sigma factor [Candidatus Neomarinimicrobiota bacterium]MDD4960953.1 RNA polymerase sigma factor [Candidatus Neomarinimicrobiota bacterium]MDD5710046.1 RNA polymerase sigma factor [Candidatus Neomarinimicrobiota bacterium]MDX9777211.1 RNA polymerase sigma factor [bacterium]
MVKKQEFETWIKNYHDRIYTAIFHIVGNEDDALDCTQEVFLKAYRKRATFRGEASPYGWLHSIATNHALNFVTRNRTKHWDEYREYEHPQTEDSETTRDFRSEWLELLTPMERRVLEARVYEKLSFRDTAINLGTTENSAKVLYHKAVKKLKQVVKDEM